MVSRTTAFSKNVAVYMHMLTIKIGTIRSKLKVVVFGEYESRAQVYYIFKVIQLVLVGGETSLLYNSTCHAQLRFYPIDQTQVSYFIL
jgi:hypothetical protein